MRRRQFIAITAGATAVAVARLSRAAVPCPPPTVSVAGGQTATTTCPNNAPNTAPAWFTSMADLTWSAPASNWLGAVKDPLADTTNAGNEGQSAIIADWTGMGTDQTRNTLFMLGNGGHAGYYGNEVYSLDVRAPAPAWVRRRDASVHDGSGNLTMFSDGRPCSDHSGMLHVEAGGRWFKAGMGGTNQYGYPHQNQWWEYDLTLEDYINRGSHFASNTPTTACCGALYDAVNNQIIVVHPGALSPSVEYVNASTLAVVRTNQNGLNVGGGMLPALDTTNRIILAKDDNTANYWWLSLANPTGQWQSLTASGAGVGGQQAFCWHPPSRAFLTWDRAGGMLKLTPTMANGNYTALTWATVSGRGGTLPAYNGAKLYNKVSIIKDMGNAQSALVVVSRYGNPDTYTLKIPAQGV